jgi:hypothetical protein
MNGRRHLLSTPSFEGHNPPSALHSSNFLFFNEFRTLMQDRNAINSSVSSDLRTTLVATEGRALQLTFLSLPNFALPFCLFCFQQLPTIKFSNHFVLITIRIARGVWCPPPFCSLFTALCSLLSVLCPTRPQVSPRVSVLKNARHTTAPAIVKATPPVYGTNQFQRIARQYAWHAEPGSPAGVPYAGERAAQRGKPLQERPLS